MLFRDTKIKVLETLKQLSGKEFCAELRESCLPGLDTNPPDILKRP